MKILAIGAHYDDIELNCAGTLLKAKEKGAEISLMVCTDGSKGGDRNQRFEEQKKVNNLIGYADCLYINFTDGKLEHNYQLINKIDEAITDLFKPDYIITHTENDFHQDHIAVAKSVKSANRNSNASLITFPSQDIKLPFEANLYVDITKYFKKKIRIIQKFESQLDKPWLQEDTIIARNLGTGIAKYVEKFHIEFLKL